MSPITSQFHPTKKIPSISPRLKGMSWLLKQQLPCALSRQNSSKSFWFQMSCYLGNPAMGTGGQWTKSSCLALEGKA